MATFSIHDDEGRITQSNTVYSAEGYDKILRDHGFDQFVRVDENNPHHHERHFVNGGQVCDRPSMSIRLSKATVKAGGADHSVLTGIMPGSRLTIITGGIKLFDEAISDTQIEINIPVPCVYELTFHKWPYRDFTCKITGET